MDLFRTTKTRDALPLRQRAEDEAAHLSFLMAEADKAVTSILHGEHRQRKSGGGERFWQFREYHPGDRPQDIDWRQSGKTDRVFIRQKEWQTNQSAYLWCSRAESMGFSSSDGLPSKGDAAKIITLAIGLLLTHGGEEIGLLGSPRKGRSQAMLQTIADSFLDKDQERELLPESEAPANSALFLAGDFLEPIEEIESRFKNLAAQSDSGVVIQILDPAEIELPYDGRVIFEAPTDKQRELVNNVSSIRGEYNRRITAHVESVRRICGACEWHYVLHNTEREIKDTLLDVWTALTIHSKRAGTLRR
ncbi:MAG: DUF58 domain-containing protein [Alphaproteobacteria bacterium]